MNCSVGLISMSFDPVWVTAKVQTIFSLDFLAVNPTVFFEVFKLILNEVHALRMEKT